MDDNIYMEPSSICSTSSGNTEDAAEGDNGLLSDHVGVKSWCPSYLLDFSDLSLGQYFFFSTCFINLHPIPVIPVFIRNGLHWNVVMAWYHNLSRAFSICKILLVIRRVELCFL